MCISFYSPRIHSISERYRWYPMSRQEYPIQTIRLIEHKCLPNMPQSLWLVARRVPFHRSVHDSRASNPEEAISHLLKNVKCYPFSSPSRDDCSVRLEPKKRAYLIALSLYLNKDLLSCSTSLNRGYQKNDHRIVVVLYESFYLRSSTSLAVCGYIPQAISGIGEDRIRK